MASKTRLDQAAGASIGGFFTKAEETKPDTDSGGRQEEYIIAQAVQMPQTAPELEHPMENTSKGKKGENGAITKPRKQVFSFRATVRDIAGWKAYATATGQTMENIGTAAMNEFLERHKLSGEEKTIFDAMKAKNGNVDL